MATSFYRWKAGDFETIYASELQVGDAIACGTGSPKGNLYGVIPITSKENLTITPGSFSCNALCPKGRTYRAARQ